MSLQALRDLRAKINQDPAIQKAARAYMSPIVDKYYLVELGKQHGFEFTTEEVEEEIGNIMANPDRELADFELELVAGGGVGGPLTSTTQEDK